MKKLMIAAAVVAMTAGAYADACDDADIIDIGGDCLVYDVTFKLKTLAPKKAVCKGCTKCDDDTLVYYLADKSRTFKGYLWFCADDCWDDSSTPYIALWDASAKKAIIPLPYAIVDNKMRAFPYDTQFSFLGRYAKKADKVAAFWEVSSAYSVFYAAGVKGSVIKDKEMGTTTLKSISGNVVGVLDVGTVEAREHCQDVVYEAQYATLCDCWEDWCDASYEIASSMPVSGTWSLKYNKKLSTGSKSMLTAVPKYVLEQE